MITISIVIGCFDPLFRKGDIPMCSLETGIVERDYWHKIG